MCICLIVLICATMQSIHIYTICNVEYTHIYNLNVFKDLAISMKNVLHKSCAEYEPIMHYHLVPWKSPYCCTAHHQHHSKKLKQSTCMYLSQRIFHKLQWYSLYSLCEFYVDFSLYLLWKLINYLGAAISSQWEVGWSRIQGFQTLPTIQIWGS